MTTTNETSKIATLRAEKEAAEMVEREAKRISDRLRAEYAAAVLVDAFPGAKSALYSRDVYEPAALLSEIYGEAGKKLYSGRSRSQTVTDEQNAAMGAAADAIALIGDDDNVLAQKRFSAGRKTEYQVDFKLNLLRA